MKSTADALNSFVASYSTDISLIFAVGVWTISSTMPILFFGTKSVLEFCLFLSILTYTTSSSSFSSSLNSSFSSSYLSFSMSSLYSEYLSYLI